MIVGVGADIVGIERFGRALAASPNLAARLFVPDEMVRPTAPERALPLESLAARFAAKEALAKALGAPRDLRWHDAVVAVDAAGRPRLETSGTVAARCEALGVRALHLTLSHDAGLALAVVVAEA
ncbi:MAG: holo-ACP synthase [Bifidobacteriaceae bacterium]|jgi:holo-[acyl-carrier protein] synthase|nr:holo-ACP synthase [Bifidobacteriaceae bacterium]